MKYVSLVCCAVAAAILCSPARAGTGNALAGGWDGTIVGRNLRSTPATAPAAPVATTTPALFGSGTFAGPVFSFGSGGSGSGGNTGGAPSPEVNAALSLILVGGTVAVLRRRRTRQAGPQA